MKIKIVVVLIIWSLYSCATEKLSIRDNETIEFISNAPERIIRDNEIIEPVSELQSLRNKWLSIDNYQQQLETYNAFTLNQKQTIWIGKMEEILRLDWTEHESRYIQSIIELIKDNPDFFLTVRSKDIDTKINVEIGKRRVYAKEELGWTDGLLSEIYYFPSNIMTADKKESLLNIEMHSKTAIMQTKDRDSSIIDISDKCGLIMDMSNVSFHIISPFEPY